MELIKSVNMIANSKLHGLPADSSLRWSCYLLLSVNMMTYLHDSLGIYADVLALVIKLTKLIRINLIWFLIACCIRLMRLFQSVRELT
jgi:hypothetical protein